MGQRLANYSGGNLPATQQPGQADSGYPNEPMPQGGGDYSEILAHQQAQQAANSKTIGRLQQQIAESEKQTQRLKKAFLGEDEKPVTESEQRIADHEQMLDYFLQEGIEGEREGRPIPLTVTVGTKLAQLGIESEKRLVAQQRQIEQLQAQIGKLADPNFKLTDNAASIMEGMLDDSLSRIYGSDPAQGPVIKAQFDAIANRIGMEIRELQKEEPETWDKIRRNPRYQRNMVNHFVSEMLPPKVRAMMENEELQNTPLTDDELWEAFQEARVQVESAETEAEALQFSNVMDEIRQELISRRYGTEGGDKRSLNKIIRSYRE